VFETSNSLDDINKLITVTTKDNISVQLGCYFTNVDGQGELETLLKAIKIKPSDYADCLEAWRECVIAKGKMISQKDFDKFWVNNYIRFDTCLNKERGRREKKCSMYNFDYILENKSHIFDFKSQLLDELKDFLILFKD
jgi:hypothetical protein